MEAKEMSMSTTNPYTTGHMEDHKKDMAGEHEKEGMMTYGMVVEKMKEDLGDEIEDCKKYLKMSKACEHAGHEKAAKYLHMIAKDEFTHARFLYEYLSEEGIDIPTEDAVKFQELKTMAEHTFRF